MAVTILENGWISDAFVLGDGPLVYSDAIVLPPEQYNALSPDEIAALKQQRYDNWIAIINTPPQE
ncbi:MAG: hypothetical protein AMJ56_00310 [Anaerolineae bacterium SG8_19]|nr:MAG: hypothetical protein AMJ56_00310 [Anaerolineae bacterium SG8_19]